VDEVGERKLVERLPGYDFQVSLLRKEQPPFSEARLPDDCQSVTGIIKS
jgi:hypothetical protein